MVSISPEFWVPPVICIILIAHKYIHHKPSKFPENFLLEVLWRIGALTATIAYTYEILTSNLPQTLDMSVYQTSYPLTVIGVIYILQYVWKETSNYLDSSFRQPENVPKIKK